LVLNSEKDLQQKNSDPAVCNHFLAATLLGAARVMFVPSKTDYN
jgi:hypothetical protein